MDLASVCLRPLFYAPSAGQSFLYTANSYVHSLPQGCHNNTLRTLCEPLLLSGKLRPPKNDHVNAKSLQTHSAGAAPTATKHALSRKADTQSRNRKTGSCQSPHNPNQVCQFERLWLRTTARGGETARLNPLRATRDVMLSLWSPRGSQTARN
jgi:hypothetical protein